MWIYSQHTGLLWNEAGVIIARGYSGHGAGKNDPSQEHVRNVGPIPRGLWKIGQPYDSKKVGKFALPLEPEGHDAHKRTAFLIHGDKAPPYSGTASHGCIILPLPIRERIHMENDRFLKVIA